METEAHVFALAIAASVLLSFYPFLTVMLSFCRNILHWPAAVQAIYLAIDDYFPGDLGVFIRHNPPGASVQVGSMLLLLLTANGVFEPLEVALNRVWCAPRNRPYWRNQLVALGMIFACGSLALLSLMFTALNVRRVSGWAGARGSGVVEPDRIQTRRRAAFFPGAIPRLLAFAKLQNRSPPRCVRSHPGRFDSRSLEIPQPFALAFHAEQN
jgi:hypothetical protein